MIIHYSTNSKKNIHQNIKKIFLTKDFSIAGEESAILLSIFYETLCQENPKKKKSKMLSIYY